MSNLTDERVKAAWDRYVETSMDSDNSNLDCMRAAILSCLSPNAGEIEAGGEVAEPVQNMHKLVERLRAEAEAISDTLSAPLLTEAADALEKAEKRIAELEAELTETKEATDPDDPGSYRSDDREGCLDAVHEIARAALESRQ